MFFVAAGRTPPQVTSRSPAYTQHSSQASSGSGRLPSNAASQQLQWCVTEVPRTRCCLACPSYPPPTRRCCAHSTGERSAPLRGVPFLERARPQRRCSRPVCILLMPTRGELHFLSKTPPSGTQPRRTELASGHTPLSMSRAYAVDAAAPSCGVKWYRPAASGNKSGRPHGAPAVGARRCAGRRAARASPALSAKNGRARARARRTLANAGGPVTPTALESGPMVLDAPTVCRIRALCPVLADVCATPCFRMLGPLVSDPPLIPQETENILTPGGGPPDAPKPSYTALLPTHWVAEVSALAQRMPMYEEQRAHEQIGPQRLQQAADFLHRRCCWRGEVGRRCLETRMLFSDVHARFEQCCARQE